MIRRHIRKLAFAVTLCSLCTCVLAATEDLSISEIAIEGRQIAEVVDDLRARGYKFAYSTSILTGDVVVKRAPTATDPVQGVEEILRPYGLTISQIDDTYLIRRDDTAPSRVTQQVSRPESGDASVVPEVTVSASRYEILRRRADHGVFVDQQQVQQLPVLGDDPVRAMHKLPGTASNGVSAKSYVRGGESVDTGIVLNGSNLIAPFHVRNLQSLFSTIDLRAVDGIEVFTGGFPVQYGNQMGGLIVMDTTPPSTGRHTELGLSVFDTSVLTSGTTSDSRIGWLVSARRGNLDLVVDERYGTPGYSDFFGQLDFDISEASSLTFNALVAINDVELVTKSDPEEREESESDSQNGQFWLNWQFSWNDDLQSVTTVSTSTFDDHRVEVADDVEEIAGSVDDSRDVKVTGMSQDWVWQATSSHRLKWGAAYERVSGNYLYDGSVEYFGAFRWFQDLPASIERHADRDIHGQTFSAYLADRWAINDATIAELGVRWEKQTYTGANPDGQLSPRLSLLHSVGPATDLRLSVGRYYQAQEIHQLQVEDGVTTFFPAQRADQVIVGLQQRFGEDIAFRAEAYWKDVDRVRPRFENVLNPITVLPEFKPDRMRIAPTAFRSRGIELSLEREVENGIGWWVSYVLSDAEDTIEGERVPRSWDQPDALQAGISRQGEHWDFSVLANVHSGWPKTSLGMDTLSDPGNPMLVFTKRNRQRYADFASVDMRIRYHTPIRYGSLSAFFELINLANRSNPCCVDFGVEPDGTNAPALELEDKNWLPLIPAVGILWEF